MITEEVREHSLEVSKKVKAILDANILYCRRGWEAHCGSNKHIKAVVKQAGVAKEDSKEDKQVGLRPTPHLFSASRMLCDLGWGGVQPHVTVWYSLLQKHAQR